MNGFDVYDNGGFREKPKSIRQAEIDNDSYIKERKNKYGNNVCPLCSGALVKRNGCQICSSCGYEKCDI